MSLCISPVASLQQYRKKKNNVVALFSATTILTLGTIKVYKIKVGNKDTYCLVKISNSRVYRLGPSLEEILIHNIPSDWQCIGVYKGLTIGNLKELYNSLFNK